MKKSRLISIFLFAVIFLNSISPICIHAYDEQNELLTSYVLMEMATGTVVMENNADEAVPVGTMAKLMTILLAAEKINSGELSLDTKIKASAAANAMQGAQIWLMPGEEMTLSDLLKGIIIGNANDASVAVAEAVAGSEESFTALMNQKAQSLGMKSTNFTNCNGYYDDSRQISSAYDIAKLSCELYKYAFLRDYFTCWLDYLRDGATEVVNSNTLVKNYNGIVGFKAGFTEASGHCISAAAERDGEAYAVVILGYSDKGSMFYDARQLLNTGFSEYSVVKPDIPEDTPDIIKVKGSYTKEIPLEYGDIKNIVIPNGTYNSISSRYFLPDYIYAPVNKGDKIGEVHFYKNDKFLFSVNILSDGCADKLTAVKAIVILLKFMMSF